MIIKGNAVTGAAALAHYLQNTDANERVTVIEIKGTFANDLHGALLEMDAYAEGTRCELPLYHGKISPEPPYTLTREQVLESVDLMEKDLGLEGHARVIVMHEKEGRQHYHPIWTRIALDEMKAVPTSGNYFAHEKTARELERRFGHPRVQGVHAERDYADPRLERSPSIAELKQEERTGIRGKDVRTEVTAIFRSSDSAQAFAAGLEEHGYVLAQGDSRVYVIVDRAGGTHSLSRRLEGMKTAELREFMRPLDGQITRSVAEAKELQLDRAGTRDQLSWEDRLMRSALEADRGKALNTRLDRNTNRDELAWEDALLAAGLEKAKANDLRDAEKRRAMREARKDDLVEAAYTGNDTYVAQANAAQKDLKRRRKKNPQSPHPMHPKDHKETGVERAFEHASGDIAQTRNPPPPPSEQIIGEKSQRFDHNQQARKMHEAAEREAYGDEGHKKTEDLKRVNNAAQRERLQSEAKARGETFNSGPQPIDHNDQARGLSDAVRGEVYGDLGPEKLDQLRRANTESQHERNRAAAMERGEKYADDPSIDRHAEAHNLYNAIEREAYGPEGHERFSKLQRQLEDDRRERQREADKAGAIRDDGKVPDKDGDTRERDDRYYERLQRENQIESGREALYDDDPDRQREAPVEAAPEADKGSVGQP